MAYLTSNKAMKRISLEHRTDLIFWRALGMVEDRGDHLVIGTPGRRGWYWGNLLIFDGPPREGDLERWGDLFQRALGVDPAVRHRLFAWSRGDDAAEEVAPFLDAGYALEESVALVASRVQAPPHVNDEVVIRAVESDDDWEAVIALETDERPERFEPESWRGFIRARMGDYRRLAERGLGGWHGAWLDGVLAGSLGLYRSGEVARFQTVTTAARYRRRGICGTLVWRVSQAALAGGVERLVMVADENYEAARIYTSVGFEPVERNAALILYPPEER